MERGSPVTLAVYANQDQGQQFGSQEQMFREIAQLAAAEGFDFFILTPGFSETAIEGYRLVATGTRMAWNRERVNWPKITFRRLVHYPARLHRLIQKEERLLEQQSLLLTLPRRLGNKWRTYQRLQKVSSLRPFLPKTAILRQGARLLPFLDEMKDMYIKPVLGSQGSRVMRVHMDAGVITLASSQMEVCAFVQNDVRELERTVSERLSGYAAVVQETVDLMQTKSGEPVDLRCLVQAVGAGGEVFVTPIARVGMRDHVTTNLHTGGKGFSCKKLEEFLCVDQVDLWRRGVAQAKTLARKVFDQFQHEYPPLFELGIDLAIDRGGQVFFLEINPCPGRRMLRQVSRDWRTRSLARMVEYAMLAARGNQG